MPITPFLMLVLAGYALFIGVLGTAWAQGALAERRRVRAARPGHH